MQGFLKGYKAVSAALLGAAIAFLFINILLWLLFALKDAYFRQNPVMERYGEQTVSAAYPKWNSAELSKLLDETWYRPMVYDAFTGFTEAPFHGTYVNVTQQGFRVSKEQGPWPPAPGYFNLFIFGGSTAFGYGLPDTETIPSYLQERLPTRSGKEVRVYNFGRGFYFSTQERLLFEKLVMEGIRPDLAVFLDRLNEFEESISNVPEGAGHLNEFFTGKSTVSVFGTLPLARAFISLRQRLGALNFRGGEAKTASSTEAYYNNKALIAHVIERYLTNTSLIASLAARARISTLFVWQPVPTFHAGTAANPFAAGGFNAHSYSAFGYPEMEKLIAAHDPRLPQNFLSLSGVQEGESGLLYVDKVHYSALLSRTIADHIAASIESHTRQP
jgi:hypothetical protein